jgi:predicted RNase H-like HicB family nuclease
VGEQKDRRDNMQKKNFEPTQETSVGLDLKLTAKIHFDGKWYVAFCAEMPGANGQGRTREECLQSLKEAVLLLMEDQREDATRPASKVQSLEPA